MTRRDAFRFWGRTPPAGTDRTPIRAQAPDARVEDGVATLRLYEPIDSWGGEWGISALEFARVLDDLDDDVREIRLHINSPGGEVFEGIAILNALRNHRARVVAVVDGIAASAASFIAAGADELIMSRNTELMIHDAWGMCVGNAEDMRTLAGELDHLSNNIASIYAAKTGGDVADWRAAMLAETWYSADEAVEAGLADRVDTGQADADTAAAKNRFDLSMFNHAGRAQAPTPPIPARAAGPQTPAAASAGGSTTPTEGGPAVAFSDEQITTLRQRLGVDDGADEQAILAALDEALEERADPPAATATPPLPEGIVAIDAAQLEELRNAAAEGRQAREQQLADRRALLVDQAVNDGRIAPARRDHWLAQLAADPGAEQVLGSLEKGLIPVEAKGHTGGLEPTEDAEYFALFPDEKKVG